MTESNAAPVLQLAVLSDLHCHTEDHGRSASHLTVNMLRSPRNQHPVESLLYLIEEQELVADVVAFPGDLADQVNVGGFNYGWSMVKEIARALEASTVVGTVGNHDIDSRGIQDEWEDPFYLAKYASLDYPLADETSRDQFWSRGAAGVEAQGCYILTVNSAFEHYSEEAARHGGLTDVQLDFIGELTGDLGADQIGIVLCHHHPIQHGVPGMDDSDLMERGAQLLEIVGTAGFDLLVHGHRHYPRLTYAGSAGSSLPVLAAASFSAATPSKIFTRTNNMFHLVQFLEDAPQDCRVAGRIESWCYGHGQGWLQKHRDSSDFPPRTGFGFDGSLEQLASEIESSLSSSGKGSLDWRRVRRSIPAVDYLTPDQFDCLVDVLEEEHRVAVQLGRVSPQQIGKKV